LLANRERVPLPSGLASIAVERCLDGLAFAALVVLVARWLPLPGWAKPVGYGMGALYLLVMAFLVWAWLVRERCVVLVSRLARRFCPSRSEAIARIVSGFLHGLGVLPDGRNLATALLLSAVLWLIGTIVNYVGFLAIGLDLPFVAAATVQVLVVIGVLLPTAPAAVGSFHFFVVMALRSFGVPEALALSYAILLHATLTVAYVLAGVTCGLAFRVKGWRRLEALVADSE
jgi:hypothetical protein